MGAEKPRWFEAAKVRVFGFEVGVGLLTEGLTHGGSG